MSKIYLSGYSEQGCGFSPNMVFRTEDDRKRYFDAFREINGYHSSYDEFEEMEFADVDKEIAEMREWKRLRDERDEEERRNPKPQPTSYLCGGLTLNFSKYMLTDLLDKVGETITPKTPETFSWHTMERTRQFVDGEQSQDTRDSTK